MRDRPPFRGAGKWILEAVLIGFFPLLLVQGDQQLLAVFANGNNVRDRKSFLKSFKIHTTTIEKTESSQ